MILRLRLWLACALCLGTALVLAVADQQGAFARRLSLGTPYLQRCAVLHDAFRCTGTPASLKVINFPIRLKVERDYRIVIRGRSLASSRRSSMSTSSAKTTTGPNRRGMFSCCQATPPHMSCAGRRIGRRQRRFCACPTAMRRITRSPRSTSSKRPSGSRACSMFSSAPASCCWPQGSGSIGARCLLRAR